MVKLNHVNSAHYKNAIYILKWRDFFFFNVI